MSLEEKIARHYASADLLARIDAAIVQAGADPAHLVIDDLKPVDEFHTGGIEATIALLDQLEITPEMVVVDLGCALGGTARHIVHRYGATVRGVDLAPDYVEAGNALNERLFLQERIDLQVGSATELPFDDNSADLVTMFHVGMNIPDKMQLFAQVARVLKPGGYFALFDVMRGESDGNIAFPVPWSGGAQTSHVDLPAVYRDAAQAAGLEITVERERRQYALDFFDRVINRVATHGLPPLGVHLLMGEAASEKLKNVVANIRENRITPVEMIFKRPLG